MKINISPDKITLGRAAAAHAAQLLQQTIATQGRARILAATGGSQFEFLEALTATPGLAWDRVELFHLDEYVGIGFEHPASFGRYLLNRFINKTGLKNHHLLDGLADPEKTCREMGVLLAAEPIDIAFAGIGENSHLAFNDPPADFVTEQPYLVVQIDEACRQQQVGEGWFPDLAAVPQRAISISVRQLLKAKTIIVPVPDTRKAQAVRLCLEGPITPQAPASILREHPDVTIYLDRHSAALLAPSTIMSP